MVNPDRKFRETCFPLLRFHLHDWLAIVLLILIEVGLLVIHPFKRFVGEFGLEDLRYPFKSNTIPWPAVPGIALGIPLVIFLICYYYRRDAHDLHHAILGLIFAVLITAVITDAVKDAVGRPRPDFFWRCFPDGKGVFKNGTREVLCTGSASDIREGHKSFPSGHTSWSFAGLGYLSLYLAGKITAFDRQGRVAKLILVIIPLLAATLVGVSRVDDYWHHWQDVFVGALIGMVVATLCYRQHYPSCFDEFSMNPYAFAGFGTGVPVLPPEDWPPRQTNGDIENGRDIEISRL